MITTKDFRKVLELQSLCNAQGFEVCTTTFGFRVCSVDKCFYAETVEEAIAWVQGFVSGRKEGSMDANRRFAELAGIEVIEPHWWCGKCQSEKSPFQVTYQEYCTVCGCPVVWREGNPDFTDAREVLRVMRNHVDYVPYLHFVYQRELRNYAHYPDDWAYLVELVIDTTGKLRDLAIEWMEGRK